MIRKIENGVFLYLGKFDPEDGNRTTAAAEEFFAAAGLPPRKIVKTSSGKPVFSAEGWYLSPTHTGSLYAVAFAPFPVGLDAEAETVEKQRVADKYFTEEEKRLPFSLVWTAKEAVSKISGEGISALGRICLSPDGKEAFFGGEAYTLSRFTEAGVLMTLARKKETL